MIRRSTVVYITILLAVLSVYLFVSNRRQPAEELVTPEPTGQVSYLFPADQGNPTSILIQENSGGTVELARNEENAWALKRPVEAAAEQGESEAAASQVTAMRVLERIPNIDLGVVGLKEPRYLITVQFSSGTERTIRVGVVTPTESGYYIQDASGGEILIVSKSSLDALLRILDTTPYLETPSPAVPESAVPLLAVTF